MLKVDKTIKVDKKTHMLLNELVGEMRAEEKRPISINEALSRLLKAKKKKHSIMDFAGSWEMSDTEAARINMELKKAWAGWKPKSF